MITTVWGVFRDGKVELSEPIPVPEGTRVLVTALPDEDERSFWLHVSESSLDAIWNNPQDDIYAELLKK